MKLYRYEDPTMGPRTMPTIERPLNGKVLYYYYNNVIIITNVVLMYIFMIRWRSRSMTCFA